MAGRGPGAHAAADGARPGRPSVSLVLDESILRRRIGTPAVMFEQLSRLVVESRRPSVDIRMVPLDTLAQHLSLER